MQETVANVTSDLDFLRLQDKGKEQSPSITFSGLDLNVRLALT
jgi:hypothetical protein